MRVRPSGSRDGRSRNSVRGSKATHGITVVFVPVPYPYAADSPFGFAAPATSHVSPFGPRDARQGGVSAGPSTYWVDLSDQPGASAGMIFDVAPAATEVYVDNVYAGIVQDFATGRDPLMVVPGTHRIELHARGYYPVALDVTIAPGQVIPFTGDLDVLRPH